MARKSRKNVVVLEQPKKPAVKVWRAALYIRLSVEFNGSRGDSLETQRQIMEAYIGLLDTSPSPRDKRQDRIPSSA